MQRVERGPTLTHTSNHPLEEIRLDHRLQRKGEVKQHIFKHADA